MKKKTILLTGGAGFIGFHLIKKLVGKYKIICVDNFNDYYEPKLKKDRIRVFLKSSPPQTRRGIKGVVLTSPNTLPPCTKHDKGVLPSTEGREFNRNFKLYNLDIADFKALKKIFKAEKIDIIVHLAAQAGVRYSLINPFVYEKTNVLGTLNLLELTKDFKVKKFVFASSSSVYGNNEKVPFSENDKISKPASLYGATKIAGEAICKSYHSLYKIPIAALRFFTVYGPWGRPDMAYFKFTKAIFENKKIDVYNFGKMSRDFTYIDDIVDGIVGVIDYNFDFEIFNLGNNKPVDLLYFIKVIEKETGKKVKKNLMAMQKGDVKRTWADIRKAKKLLGWQPTTKIEEGIERFVEWYRKYYNI